MIVKRMPPKKASETKTKSSNLHKRELNKYKDTYIVYLLFFKKQMLKINPENLAHTNVLKI